MLFFRYLCPSVQDFQDFYTLAPLAEQLCACCGEYCHSPSPWRPSNYETRFQSPLTSRLPTVIYHQETYIIEAPSTFADSALRERAPYRSLPRQATGRHREPHTAGGISTDIQSSNPYFKPSSQFETQKLIEAESSMPDHTALYSNLGLRPSATATEIKTAYRELALKCHPDKSDAPGAADEFKIISHAYAILSDERLKKLYDRWGPDAAEHPNEYDEAGEPREVFEYDHNLRGARPSRSGGNGAGGYRPDRTRRGGLTEGKAGGSADARSYYTRKSSHAVPHFHNTTQGTSSRARPQPTQSSRPQAPFSFTSARSQPGRTPWTDPLGNPFVRVGTIPEIFNLFICRSTNTFRQEAGVPPRVFTSQAPPRPVHRGELVYGPGSPGSVGYDTFHGMGSRPIGGGGGGGGGGYDIFHGMGSRPGGGIGERTMFGGRGRFGDDFSGGGFMSGFSGSAY